MLCVKCGLQNAEGMNFCGRCGSNLRDIAYTPASDRGMDESSLINRYLTPRLSEKILAARGRVEGERKHVTAVFADMKGFTALSEAVGEEAIYGLMDPVYECMITSVLEEEGSVQKLTGDGIFALFGAPVALEDAPLRACRAALRMLERMCPVSDKIHHAHGVKPDLRIGVHTGPVVIGSVGTDSRMEFTALGDTVNLASRLEGLADPGSIFISDATRQLVDAFVQTEHKGARQVKGKEAPQEVYALRGLKKKERFDAAIHKGLTPFVGRDDEISELARGLDLVRSGRMFLAQLCGEPGIGKSRLVHEFQKRVSGMDVHFLKTHCTASGRTTSYLPFAGVVKGLFGMDDSDSNEQASSKLSACLGALGLAGGPNKAILMEFMGFKPEGGALRGLDEMRVGELTRELLLDVIGLWCSKRPTVLVFEDLHWMDRASEALLGQLMADGRDVPLLLLCTYRPEYESPWRASESSSLINVGPLEKESAAMMISKLLGGARLSEDVAGAIIGRSECNPLFTEEVTRYLLGSGRLKRFEREVTYDISDDKLNIPTSIIDLLQSRVDMMPDKTRELLQVAAVVGRRFPHRLTREVSGLGSAFEEHILALEDNDLVIREVSAERVEFKFKHALIQDAIYDSLLTPRRMALHRKVGEAIEMLYPERLPEWTDTLSHHWSNTDDLGKAVKYTIAAGEKSLKVYALDEADRRFAEAMSMIDKQGAGVDNLLLTDVLLSWVRVYFYRQHFSGLVRLVEKYMHHVEALGDRWRTSMLLFWAGHAYNASGQGEKALRALLRARGLGEELGDSMCIRRACSALLWSYAYWIPDHEVAGENMQLNYKRAMELADHVEDSFSIYFCYLAMGIYHLMNGRFSEALKHADKLFELGNLTGDRRHTATGHWVKGNVYVQSERFEEAIEHAEKAYQMSTDPLDRMVSRTVIGGALVLSGRVGEGFEIMTALRKELYETGFYFPMAAVEIFYGACLVLSGRMGDGVGHIKKFLEFYGSLGNYTTTMLGNVVLSDVYTMMATSKAKPPFRVILNNLWFILTSAPVAEKKALEHIKLALDMSTKCGGYANTAKAYRNLAKLSIAKGDTAGALEHIARGMEAAALAGATKIHDDFLRMREGLPPAARAN